MGLTNNVQWCLGCSETLAHNEIDFSRLFSNLQLPLSVITDVDMFILLIILLIYPSAQTAIMA